MKRKVAAFILRTKPSGVRELLFHSFETSSNKHPQPIKPKVIGRRSSGVYSAQGNVVALYVHDKKVREI